MDIDEGKVLCGTCGGDAFPKHVCPGAPAPCAPKHANYSAGYADGLLDAAATRRPRLSTYVVAGAAVAAGLAILCSSVLDHAGRDR